MTRSLVNSLDRLQPPTWPIVALLLGSWNAFLAVALGKELNWDLLNYHFYNGYAFLHGRLDRDLAPAQMQTFFTPLLDVPLYLAIVSLPPVVVGALYGFVQGLNGVAVWLIAREMLPVEEGPRWQWAAVGLAFVGGLGPINIGELGGSMADTLVSVPVLFSLAVLLRAQRRLETAPLPVTVGWTALAGALSGFAVALKLSAALFTAGFTLGCLFLVRALGRRVLVAFVFGAAAVGAWLLVSGFWLWEMWSRYGDPLFPYVRLFNARPEWAGIRSALDTRFLPKSAVAALLYPFVWMLDPRAVSESYFRDWRLPLLYVLLVIVVIRWGVRRWRDGRSGRDGSTGPAAFLIVGGLASYALWLVMFAIYRYLAPLEWLAPLAIALALMALLPRRYWAPAIVVVLLLTTVTTRPTSWGRAGWTRSYFDVTAPQFAPGDSPMVLLAGVNALSYVVPYLREDVRVVRLQSNGYLYGVALGGIYGAPGPPNHFDDLVRNRIAAHRGSLYVMYDGLDRKSELAGAYELDAILRRLRLRVLPESCQQLRAPVFPPPPWRIVWKMFGLGYTQPPLLPFVTLCGVVRGTPGAAFVAPEFRGDAAPIARLYFAVFNRTPDRAGLHYWVSQLKGGTSLPAIAEAFTKSPEFNATYGPPLTNERFVQRAYHNVFGRDPDPAGATYWVGQLASGALTRPQVLLKFVESQEFQDGAK